MSIKAKTKFYYWAKRKGLDLAFLEVENLNFESPEQIQSSFKNRALEIKNKYNHSFSYKCEHHFKGIAELERFITNNLNITL